MNPIELISLTLNFLLGSGLAGMLIFYRSKRRKASADAGKSEAELDSQAIRNALESAVEWKAIAESREAKNIHKDKTIDRLYVEKSEDRAEIHRLTTEVHEGKIREMELSFKACSKPKCIDREPQTGF